MRFCIWSPHFSHYYFFRWYYISDRFYLYKGHFLPSKGMGFVSLECVTFLAQTTEFVPATSRRMLAWRTASNRLLAFFFLFLRLRICPLFYFPSWRFSYLGLSPFPSSFPFSSVLLDSLFGDSSLYFIFLSPFPPFPRIPEVPGPESPDLSRIKQPFVKRYIVFLGKGRVAGQNWEWWPSFISYFARGRLEDTGLMVVIGIMVIILVVWWQ